MGLMGSSWICLNLSPFGFRRLCKLANGLFATKWCIINSKIGDVQSMAAMTFVWLLQLLLAHSESKSIAFEIGFRYSGGAVAGGSVWKPPIRSDYACAQKLIAFIGLEKYEFSEV